MQVPDRLCCSARGREDQILVDDEMRPQGDRKEHTKESCRRSPKDQGQSVILGHTALTHEAHTVHSRNGGDESGGETSGGGGGGLAGGVLARTEGVSGETGQGLEDDEAENGAPEGGPEGPADLQSDVEVGGSNDASEERADDSCAPVRG